MSTSVKGFTTIDDLSKAWNIDVVLCTKSGCTHTPVLLPVPEETLEKLRIIYAGVNGYVHNKRWTLVCFPNSRAMTISGYVTVGHTFGARSVRQHGTTVVPWAAQTETHTYIIKAAYQQQVGPEDVRNSSFAQHLDIMLDQATAFEEFVVCPTMLATDCWVNRPGGSTNFNSLVVDVAHLPNCHVVTMPDDDVRQLCVDTCKIMLGLNCWIISGSPVFKELIRQHAHNTTINCLYWPKIIADQISKRLHEYVKRLKLSQYETRHLCVTSFILADFVDALERREATLVLASTASTASSSALASASSSALLSPKRKRVAKNGPPAKDNCAGTLIQELD